MQFKIRSKNGSLFRYEMYVLYRGTSIYVYDDTAKVNRYDRKDICEFSEGKQYYADLNALYNIEARFFIRAAIKSLFEKRRLEVSKVLVRTEQTLSILCKLCTCLS